MIIADYLKIDQKALKTDLWLQYRFCNCLYSYHRFYGAIFLGQIKVYQLLPYGLEPYIYTKEKPLYHRINTSIFHNVSARVFSLWSYNRFWTRYSNLRYYWIVIAVLITILFFVVMRKTRSYPRRIMNEAEKKRENSLKQNVFVSVDLFACTLKAT
jgi:hypothetical protein